MKLYKVLTISFLFSGSLWAQQWQWPEKPKNLKVLPMGTSPAQLREVMTGFTRGLGIRCSFCHLGEEGQPLDKYDFVSDDKEMKRTTRLMIKLVQTINESQLLKEVQKDRAKPITVTCVTCHHGNSKPMLIEDEMLDTIKTKGAAEAVKHYRELRDKFYGGFVYDFRENMLIRVVDKLDSSHTQDAVEILKLNAEMYPKSAITYFYLGAQYEVLGDKSAAIENYEKTLEINPKNEQAKKKMDKLKSGK